MILFPVVLLFFLLKQKGIDWENSKFEKDENKIFSLIEICFFFASSEEGQRLFLSNW